MSTHSAGQRAEVKAGCKPVHFSLETLHKTGLFSDITLYNREGVTLYSSLETPSISTKATLEKEILSLIVNANIVKNPKQFFKELKKELNLKRGTEND